MSTSRRTILTGTAAALAGGAAVNLGALAIAKAGPVQLGDPSDPIFAAIERHRTDVAAINADPADDDLSQAAIDNAAAYYEALRLHGEPTTAAGWAALLRYVTEYESGIGDVTDQLQEFAGRLAAALEQMAVAS